MASDTYKSDKMPNRPTREFVKKLYPKLWNEYHSKETVGKVIGTAWKNLHPSTKKKYELIRVRRERRQ